jgi:hypothetical protein
MAKDDKGGGAKDDEEKKAAVKGVQDIQGGIDYLRALHDKMGKQLDEYDKNAAALLVAIQKDNEAEQKKRWEVQRKLQDKILEVTQDITQNKQKTADKAFKAIDAYIRS